MNYKIYILTANFKDKCKEFLKFKIDVRELQGYSYYISNLFFNDVSLSLADILDYFAERLEGVQFTVNKSDYYIFTSECIDLVMQHIDSIVDIPSLYDGNKINKVVDTPFLIKVQELCNCFLEKKMSLPSLLRQVKEQLYLWSGEISDEASGVLTYFVSALEYINTTQKEDCHNIVIEKIKKLLIFIDSMK